MARINGRHTSLTAEQQAEVRGLRALGEPAKEIARAYGVSPTTIYAILRGRYVTGPMFKFIEAWEGAADGQARSHRLLDV